MKTEPRRSSNLHRIEVNLREIRQLFNSMDPAPFNEKDLDQDAEEFIEGWAMEFPHSAPVSLTQQAAQSVLRESLLIGGWVAMWRPMEIFLYEWWPLLRRGQTFRKLSRMPVELRPRSD